MLYILSAIALPQKYADSIYHPLKADIISKIYHPPVRVDIIEKDDCSRNRLFLGADGEIRTHVRLPAN